MHESCLCFKMDKQLSSKNYYVLDHKLLVPIRASLFKTN